MSEKEINFFNQLAQRWDDLRCADNDKISRLVAMAGLREGDAVLDVGCGTGVLLPFLKQAVGVDGHITAVDYAANMIARAAEKNKHLTGIDYACADIREFCPAALLDAVICFNFFPHIKDKEAFIVNMKTRLKHGGALIIMHDISRQAVNAVHQSSDTVKNDRLPDSSAVAGMLIAAGYEVPVWMDNDEFYFIKAVYKM
jgi:demethylmenaquinone methyltransferase/2-methoxy-6-polyprenyl-1,4-benzoquinol methylase